MRIRPSWKARRGLVTSWRASRTRTSKGVGDGVSCEHAIMIVSMYLLQLLYIVVFGSQGTDTGGRKVWIEESVLTYNKKHTFAIISSLTSNIVRLAHGTGQLKNHYSSTT